MTLRAFLIGAAAVIGLALLDPFTSYMKSYGWNTVGHFPTGPVFLLVVLTVGVNALLKLVRRGWALGRSELMLIWCMLIVACVAPSDGMMRLWPAAMAGPAYVARRPDIPWRETALADIPEPLLLAKDPKSVAAKRYFQGTEGGRVPWHLWLTPASRWAMLMVPFLVGVLLLFAILRRQWVDRERLQFPLARVPLEFTRGSAGAGWLPALFANRAFVIGLIASFAFRFLRALPLLFGRDEAWGVTIPFQDVLADTPLAELSMVNVDIWWNAIGFAYLVPADVSLSIWFFYLVGRFELQTSAWYGSSLHYGGTWSQLMYWQMAGAYVVFTLGTLYMARRHLAAVAARAVGAGRSDDSDEPVGYRLAFWGFAACTAAVVVWLCWYGMKLWVAVALLFLALSVMLCHARIVAQSGMYVTQPNVSLPSILHGLGFGNVFSSKGAIIGVLWHGIFINGSTSLLGPPAIHAFQISEVFKRRRRLLLPALIVAMLLAMAASGWTAVRMGYRLGGANFSDTWGQMDHPRNMFWEAHQITQNPDQHYPPRWVPLGIGVGLTGIVMFMRARFYWWPIHPIGLLGISNWHIDRLWLPFLLGWLTKVSLMKFGSGRAVHQARFFFMALILEEAFVGGISTLARTLSSGSIPGF